MKGGVYRMLTRILGVSITATGKKDIVPVPAAVHIPLKSGGE